MKSRHLIFLFCFFFVADVFAQEKRTDVQVDTLADLIVTIDKDNNSYRVERLVKKHTAVYDSIPAGVDKYMYFNHLGEVYDAACQTVINGISVEKIEAVVFKALNLRREEKFTGRMILVFTISKTGDILKYQIYTSPVDLSNEDCIMLYNALNDAGLFVKWTEDVDKVSLTVALRI